MPHHDTSRTPPKRNDGRSTRGHLLETAGQVFAEKGFDRANGKEICERAGTNPAAVNYYFGGMDGLYAAVLREVPGRLVSVEALSAAVAGETDAKAKLEAFIGLIVRTLTGPASSSWALRVVARELISPSPALDALRDEEMLPKGRLLRSIVAELMRLPEDHPAVARGCLSVLSPCLVLLICDRSTLEQVFPHLGLGSEDSAAVVRHMVRFALAGLAAVAAD